MDIPLDQLRADERNANIMPEAMLAKLTAHIERTGRYPAVIVREDQARGPGGTNMPAQTTPSAAGPPGVKEPRYVIVDGHHRVQALCRLGRATARCEVWDIDDHEAAVLLATLNRLEGGDDPKKRAKLAATIAQCGRWGDSPQAMAQWLPERAEQVRRLLEMRRPIDPPRPPQPLAAMPTAVHFFLTPDQRRRLEARLQEIGGPREQALMTGLGIGTFSG